MAYIRKYRDKWRAEVERNGVRRSRTFDTKAAATRWAAAEEAEILAVKHGALPAKTLREAIDRYIREVSPTKRGARFERLRLEAFLRDFPALADKRLAEVGTPDMAGWRDARLKLVSPGSVQRDINLLSNLFTVARDEWRWRDGDSPFRGMRAPGDNPPRDRRPTPMEVRRICRWLGYRTGQRQATKQAEVALAFLVSLRTAMRASEVLSLSSETVDLNRRVATVKHKMQHQTGRPRQVPLTRQAVRLLAPCLPGRVFTLSGASLDALFRKATAALLIPDLHFHDARGDALTRLARRVDVMTLARISGHRDLRVLLHTYYRESAADIAARLG